MTRTNKQIIFSLGLLLFSMATSAQSTARKFMLNISNDGESNLTCYLPANPSGRAIVDCPGGGYSHLSMEKEGHDWAEYFNQQGIAYFVLKYRMPKGDRSIPMGDAYQAIRTVRDSSASWHINPHDVGIMGFSAGGHLASTVSTHADYAARPNFTILFYPVVSMDYKKTHYGSCINFLGEEGMKDQKLIDEYSNYNKVRVHTTPRAIILLANDDQAVPPVTNGIAYYSAMRNQGNECSMCIYPTGRHGFGFRTTWAFHDQMLSDLTRWLQSFKAPKEDAVRVACIGNSITEGFGIPMASQDSYPAQLQTKLGEGYNVQNFGISARTMLNKGDLPYMNETLWKEALAFQPNIAIIKLGTNDSKTHNWQDGKEFAKDMQQMIDSLKALPSKPQIYLCSPIPAFKDIWTIKDSIIVNGEIPAIKKLVKKNKCQFIDLHTLYTYSNMMQEDGIHPNAKGAEKIASIISEAILNTKK